MFIISYALLGNILSNLLMVIIGVYFMLLFSGTLSPRAKDEAGRQRFEEYREKRGRVVVFTAGLVVFWGVLRLLVSLGFLNL